MAKSSSPNRNSKKNGMKFKTVVEKLQKSFLLGKKSLANNFDEFENSQQAVPNDVKKGHFAVIAVDDEKLKKFIIPLSYLTHPSFLRLLEKAAEEYGFEHEGAVMVPCRPSDLERILANKQWNSCTSQEVLCSN